ncbi:hypothetical protein BWI93_02725 [Siphonobacter sp. BAB-5385]|uniref:DUF4494 domain-containing protein n=1 Tax=Siphonobacter sp. BAB-5385 TaxID=1864822 RepID=UPI000B9EDE61|nr:DUF4494 domain-containing protein [Siphonobacter sp. BAB-5385]OZI09657.1 hypothetical protein BWI93_02725 [Siphonobacter sp. BAB-5385]
MATWFLGKIRFTKEIDAGKFQTVTEAYLLDAVSFTDAEARLYDLLGDNAPDFRVISIVPMKVQEVFHVEGPEVKWYKVKIMITTFDEKIKKEKKNAASFLVNADSIHQAHDRVEEALGRVEDYEITDVALTPILEVVPYTGERTDTVAEIAKDLLDSMQHLSKKGVEVEVSINEPFPEEKKRTWNAEPEKEKPLKTGKDYSPRSKHQNYPKVDSVNYD